MAEPVRFDGDASSLIRELDKLKAALRGVDLATLKVIDDNVSFERVASRVSKSGKSVAYSLQAVQRDLKLVDRFGNKVSASFSKLGDRAELSSAKLIQQASAANKAVGAIEDLAKAQDKLKQLRTNVGQESLVSKSLKENISEFDIPNASLGKQAAIASAQERIRKAFLSTNVSLEQFNALLNKVKSGKFEAITGETGRLNRELRNLFVLLESIDKKAPARLPTSLEYTEAAARSADAAIEAMRSGIGSAVERAGKLEQAWSDFILQAKLGGAAVKNELNEAGLAYDNLTRRFQQGRIAQLREEARRAPRQDQPVSSVENLDPVTLALRNQNALREAAARIKKGQIQVENQDLAIQKRLTEELKAQTRQEERAAIARQSGVLPSTLPLQATGGAGVPSGEILTSAGSRDSVERLRQIQQRQNNLLEAARRIKQATIKVDNQDLAIQRNITEELKAQAREQERARIAKQSGVLPETLPLQVAQPTGSVELITTAGNRNAVERLKTVRQIQRFEAAGNAEKAKGIALNNKLIAQRRVVGALVEQANGPLKRTKDLTASMVKNLSGLARVTGVSAFIVAAFELKEAITEAARAAAELSIKVAEIETISNESANQTEQWTSALQELSKQFGGTSVEQAEGAYQILSRQIRSATGDVLTNAEAVRFLADTNKLAIAGVTDVSTATNALTSVLNAYKLNASDAASISARLFETVRLGNVRIETLNQGFGRVLVPASSLGVELNDLLGAISTISNQGVEANETYTFLRGIFQKLLKPTDAMRKVFNQLGVASGEALIAQRGLIPALNAIQEVGGSSSTELAELFNRVRALTGVFALSGENAKRAASDIASIADAGKSLTNFEAATNKVLNSTGKTLERFGKNVQVAFEREVAEPALKAITQIVRGIDDLEGTIRGTIDAIKLVGIAMTGAFVSRTVYNGITAIAGQMLLLGTISSATAGKIQLVAASLGAAVAVGAALVAASEYAESLSEQQLAEQAKVQGDILKLREDTISKTTALETDFTNALFQEFSKRRQSALNDSQEHLKVVNSLIKINEKLIKDSEKEFRKVLSNIKKIAGEQAAEITRSYKELTKEAEEAKKFSDSLVRGQQRRALDIALDFGGSGQDIALLDQQIAGLKERVQSATDTGELELFKRLATELSRLTKLRADAEIDFNKKATQILQERYRLEGQYSADNNEQARRGLRQELADRERILQILKEGGEVQLQQELRIAKLRADLNKATTPEEKASAYSALEKAVTEQERLNRLAELERGIRERTLKTEEELANKALQIQKQRLEAARSAEREQAAARSLKLEFELLSEEARAFKLGDIKSLKELPGFQKDVAKQLQRLEKLRGITSQLGGGPGADKVLRDRQIQLVREVNLEAEKLRDQAQQDRLVKIKQEGELAKKQAEDQYRERSKNLALELAAIQEARKRIGESGLVGENGLTVRENFGGLLGDQTTSELAKLGASFETLAAALPSLEGAVAGIQKLLNTPNTTEEDIAPARAAVATILNSIKDVLPGLRPGTSLQDLSPEQKALIGAVTALNATVNRLDPAIQTALEARDEVTAAAENAGRLPVIGRPNVSLSLPEISPLQSAAQVAAKTFAKEATKGLTEGAKEAGKAEAKAKQEEEKRLSKPSTGIGAGPRPKRPELEPKRFGIQLGQGALPVEQQFARIQAQVEQEAEARRKAAKQIEEQRRIESQARIQQAISTGQARVTDRGLALVGSIGDPAIYTDIAQQTLTVQQSALDEQRKTNQLLAGRSGVGAPAITAEEALRKVRPLGPAKQIINPITPQVSFLPENQSVEQAPPATPINFTILEAGNAQETAELVFQKLRRFTRLGLR